VKGRKKKESERTTGPTEAFVFSGPDAFGGSKMENGVIIAIAVEGLAKRFGDVQAVADASFEVRRGELFGFLGPNGAGKTTTINMLTGLARPDAGTIRQIIADHNRSGTTVLLTTHYIEEAERLSGRIAFIVNGRIVCIDTVENLIEPIREKHVMELAVSNNEKAPPDKLAAAFPQLAFRNLSTGQVRVESSEPIHVGPLVRFLEEQGVEVMEARKMRPSLEEVFVQITGIETEAMRKEKEKAGGGA
jgi:ABC-type multidrug transport system ATPase subunit